MVRMWARIRGDVPGDAVKRLDDSLNRIFRWICKAGESEALQDLTGRPHLRARQLTPTLHRPRRHQSARGRPGKARLPQRPRHGRRRCRPPESPEVQAGEKGSTAAPQPPPKAAPQPPPKAAPQPQGP